MVHATLDNKLRARLDSLPEGTALMLMEALSIPNVAKIAAQKQHVWGWQQLPDRIVLWEIEGEWLVMPRGFARDFAEGMRAIGEEIDWTDHRVFERVEDLGEVPDLRPWQIPAAKALASAHQGIYKAPAGCVSGNTKIRLNRAGKGFETTIEHAYKKFHGIGGTSGPSWDRGITTYCRALVDGIFRQHRVEDIVASGVKPTILITLESSKQIRCTRDHGVLSEDGWKKAGSLQVGENVTVNGQLACVRCGRTDRRIIGAKPRVNRSLPPAKYPKLERIISIEDAGDCETYDMVMEDPHNNFVANGIVVHNSGKTVTILALIRQLRCKSLVIVNTKDIVWQWQERARQFLGEDFPIGQIGDGVFDVSEHLTIATAQTLHSRFEDLEHQGFFEEFSLVCLDESHHCTAETYNRLLDRFSARYRVGVSATPDKTGDFALATLVLGPIVHETKPAAVTSLMRPEVIRVVTKFNFAFRPTRNAYQRSNYGQMIQALVTDPDRNRLIAQIIKEEEGHHGLAISKRLEHLDILEALLYDLHYDGHILKLTGKENRDDRLRVVEISGSEPCIILSTLADEALDIPRLDRGFLCFPQKNSGLVTQQVGRFERVHPDKKDAKIYDFADIKIGPFEKQWQTRRFEVYEPRGYRITNRKAGENG